MSTLASGQATARSRTADQGTAYVPLSRLAICLDCEVCFSLGPQRCPACGSETWSLVARFLQRFADETPVGLRAGQTHSSAPSLRRSHAA